MATTFNTNIEKQFIPYWNGMLHLVGRVDDDILIKRYDWDNILRECKTFERSYMNTKDYCESCPFGQMPDYLRERAKGWDCKELAQDNDIIYTYCVERRRRMILIRAGVAAGLLVMVFIAAYMFLYGRKTTPSP